MHAAPLILVFDSGLGGLTVFSEVRRVRPDARFLYAADDAVFPYGRLSETEVVERVTLVVGLLIAEFSPDVVVIACHTASTLVLQPLRAAWPGIPFVGTVPAIKPAAAISSSKRVSVLATPGTVAREYTRDLIDTFASDCYVTLVGSRQLATLAEAAMRGETLDDAVLSAEMRDCFVEDDKGRTDTIVLGCTHYPLLLDDFRRLAIWPVNWVDPAPAIARRVDNVLEASGFARQNANAGDALAFGRAVFTSNIASPEPLLTALRMRGFSPVSLGRPFANLVPEGLSGLQLSPRQAPGWRRGQP